MQGPQRLHESHSAQDYSCLFPTEFEQQSQAVFTPYIDQSRSQAPPQGHSDVASLDASVGLLSNSNYGHNDTVFNLFSDYTPDEALPNVMTHTAEPEGAQSIGLDLSFQSGATALGQDENPSHVGASPKPLLSGEGTSSHGDTPGEEEAALATQDKPYGCPKEGCGAAFTRRGDLTRHQKKHEPPTLHCQEHGCRYRFPNGFYRFDKLRRHQTIKHALGLKPVRWGYSKVLDGNRKFVEVPKCVDRSSSFDYEMVRHHTKDDNNWTYRLTDGNVLGWARVDLPNADGSLHWYPRGRQGNFSVSN